MDWNDKFQPDIRVAAYMLSCPSPELVEKEKEVYLKTATQVDNSLIFAVQPLFTFSYFILLYGFQHLLSLKCLMEGNTDVPCSSKRCGVSARLSCLVWKDVQFLKHCLLSEV
jgi:hypothetical protein